jgi:hypothetical protein
MIAAIIACEIGFWVLLVSGLAARYVLRARRLSTALLLAVPLVDVLLLAISVVDLRRGGEAGAAHGLAAVYIGVSVAFGHQMISWADQRFAHRFAGGPAPQRPPRAGRAHAARERRQWLRHLLAYLVAAGVLALFTALVGDLSRVAPLWAVMAPWGIGVVVDFFVSFSYTVAPRGEPAPGDDRREPRYQARV